MADKPDLSGKVFGLKETLPGDPCFDPMQPWFVNFVVQNIGTGPAGPFSVKMETWAKGLGFDMKSEFIGWATKTFEMPESFGFVLGPTQVVSADYRLPVGIVHTDVGSKFVLVFIIDPDHEVDEPEATRDNNVVWVLETLPILTDAPPPPPSPWDIRPSAVIGEKNVVVARIKNQSAKTLAASTVELVLRVPKPGSPFGKPQVVNTRKIPALKPGAEALVSLPAKQNFILAELASEKSTKGVSKTGPSLKKTGTVGRSKSGTGLKTQGQLGGNLKVTHTTKFKAIIPFSLRIEGADFEVGFGGPSATSKSGKIKPPGKK